MTEKQTIQSLVTLFAEKFLEEHFGETPDKTTVTFRPPFLLIHLSGFLMPSEEIFVEKGNLDNVLKTRDIIIDSEKDQFLKGLQEHTGQNFRDLYADWNLTKRSGVFIAVMENVHPTDVFHWPQGVQEDTLREIIILNSIRTQKKPDQTNFYWLDEHILLVERIGILIDIEKQLLKNGLAEELRLAKRPMEQRIIELFNLESILNSTVQELFVDWNFQQDLSYMLLLLKKQDE
ncbi:Na-translocating system protein MpsC family protein [Metaplanococcus flavidus]|uniref:Na-translocating system protein MpsC family protein n=1 Tax=Metaplanococcus flavidus TaxID=569883 RepID=A0ABW3LED7_9BACL